ncbi:MAG: WD40 repeat domain-containing protein, partial [Bacteroidia bacterium]|nr:WD40 repeat domain-containing protein [Bacteroidia bacterium]
MFRPERNPVANLAVELANCLKYENKDTVEANLQLGYSAIVDLYKNSPLFNEKNPRESANLFILVDQFEELFTYTENYSNGSVSAQVKLLSNLLLETYLIAKQEDLPIYVVCTMRSDYISHCAAVNGFPELIGESHFFVPRLKRAELINIIEEPALLTGNKISKRLVSRLVNDVKDGTDALPVLQHALNQIWHQYELNEADEMDLIHYSMVGGLSLSELPESEQLEISEWFESLPEYKKNLYLDPGLHNVLNAHADEIFETAHLTHPEVDISKEESQHIIESTFKCLTKIDDNKAIRNRMTLKEIAEMIGGEELSTIEALLLNYRMEGNTLLYPFVKNGAKNGQLSEDSILDITHEALIRNWKKLKDWTNEEHESVKIYEDYNTQLERWLENDKKKDFLLPLGSLSYFETWYKNQSYEPLAWIKRYVSYDKLESQILNASNVAHSKTVSSLKQGVYDSFVATHFSNIKDFIYQSRKNVDRKKKFARVVSIVISVLLVISVAALFWNIHLRKISKSNEIAMKSFLKLEDDPTLAYRFAENAYQIKSTSLAKQALMEAYCHPPFYNLLDGHKGFVTNAVFSPDGQFILTASRDKTAKLWNLEGKELNTLRGHTQPLAAYTGNTASFSSDGQYIVTGSLDSTARLWSAQGKFITKMEHDGAVYFCQFSKDNQTILSTSSDNFARIWNLDGKCIQTLQGHRAKVYDACYSKDGNTIVTISADSTAIVWNKAGEKVLIFKKHNARITEVSFLNDQSIITTDSKGQVILWDINGNVSLTIQAHAGEVRNLAVAHNGSYFITTGYDKLIKIWDLEGKHLTSLEGHDGLIWDIAISSHDSLIATTANDGTIRIWNTQGIELSILKGHTAQVFTAAFSPDDKLLVTTSHDATARVWKISPMKKQLLLGHSGYILNGNFSSNGQYVVTAGWDYSARIWDIEGRLVQILDDHPSIVIYYADFLPNNKYVLTTCSDHNVRIWDFKGELIQTLTGHTSRIWLSSFTPDSKYILTSSSQDNVKLWNIEGKDIYTFKDSFTACFSPNGRRISVVFENDVIGIYHWDGKNDSIPRIYKEVKGYTFGFYTNNFSPKGTYISTLLNDSTVVLLDSRGIVFKELNPLPDEIHMIRFSKDEKYVLAVCENTVHIWEIQGSKVAVLNGHTEVIHEADFSPDSKYIITGSDDYTARLWDITGKELLVYSGHKKAVRTALFSPNGKSILTTSRDHTARIMPISIDE